MSQTCERSCWPLAIHSIVFVGYTKCFLSHAQTRQTILLGTKQIMRQCTTHNFSRMNPFEVVENSHDRPSEFSIRKQAEKNRQSSTDEIDPIFLADFRDRIYRLDAEIYSLYSEMLEAGCARECARNLLPLYTPTKLHMQGTIRSFVHYVGLRAKEDTQLEHQLIARQIAMILGIEMPTVTKAAVDSDDPALEGWKFLRVLN